MVSLKTATIILSAACALGLSSSFASPAEAKGHNKATTTDASDSGKGLDWNTSLSKGLAQAKKENKFVLADFYTDWCGYCKKLDATTFADPDFAKYVKDKFVLVRTNPEQNQEGLKAAQENRLHGWPTALIYSSDGKVVGKVVGWMPTKEYEDKLAAIVKDEKAQR